MATLAVLAPNVFDDPATKQGANIWYLLARFDPDSMRPLARTCAQTWDMMQNVAFSISFIGVQGLGFPSEPDPFGFDLVSGDGA